MESIYLECIDKNDKDEFEFRTNKNEIFSYQNIVNILRDYGKYIKGGRAVFAYINNRYIPIKPTTHKLTGEWHLIPKGITDIDSNYLENLINRCSRS